MSTGFALDTHFHANVAYLSKSARRRKAKLVVPALGHLNAVCSTEHAYKDPLLAYDFLVDSRDQFGGAFEVVPGIENISSEGVELIFLAPSRKHLEDIIHRLPAFGWSMLDFERIRQECAVTIVPHPFSPSKTGVVTTFGQEVALEIIDQHHYVEVCNGAFLNPVLRKIPSKTMVEKIRKTANFPDHLLHQGLRGSIGSDAHRIPDINCFGVLDGYDSDISTFENLRLRKKISPMMLGESSHPMKNLMATLTITGMEALHKLSFRMKNR
jgi:hypothetical protein